MHALEKIILFFSKIGICLFAWVCKNGRDYKVRVSAGGVLTLG